MKMALAFTFLFGIISSLYGADNNLSYVPSGAIEDRLREGIENARQGIDLCVHSFAALDIENDLEGAKNKGVRLRVVILRHGNGDAFGTLAKALIRKGFDVRMMSLRTGDEPVCDFIVFDDRVLVTGVYNWQAYRGRTISNDILFRYNPVSVQSHKDAFYQLFAKAEAVPLAVIQAEVNPEKNAAASGAVAASTAAKQVAPDDIEDDESGNKKPEKPVKEKRPKEFIDISLEELDTQVGKKSAFPRSKRNELWEKYKGKYVRWRGYVSYKGMGRVDWNRVGISSKRKKNADVEVLFDWTMFDRVVNLREGCLVTYTGRLVSRPFISAPFRLDDGDIE